MSGERAGQRIGLVGCVKSKLTRASRARDLYTSPLFRGRRRYVEKTCDEWYVLSAAHGVVEPNTILEPYDVSLADASTGQRREWAQSSLEDLEARLGDLRGVEFEIHAGAPYRDFGLVEGLRGRGATVIIPAAGLNQGQQLAFYVNEPGSGSPRTEASGTGPGTVSGAHHPYSGERFAPAVGAPPDGAPTLAHPSNRRVRRILRDSMARALERGARRLRSDTHEASDASAATAPPPPPPPLLSPPPSPIAPTPPRLENAQTLREFTYQWPDATETFTHGWDFDAVSSDMRYRVRHAIGQRRVFGRDRVHSVTWVNRVPIVEATETESYPRDRTLAAILKLPSRADARRVDELPAGYDGLNIAVHRDVIHGPNARQGLAAVIRENDLHTWARLAVLRYRYGIQQHSTPTRAEPVSPASRHLDANSQAVVRALLDHAVTLAPARDEVSGKPLVTFTPNTDANAFLISDPFAFLTAVICDQGIRAERAWEAPYRLRERLGHWDLDRIADEPDSIRHAFQQRPALHRMVDKVPRWISHAAAKVRSDYDSDAAQIWPARSSARDVRRRLDAFEGIGQKKAAMAVEILERDLGVTITDLAGSDIAYDVHVRRVFLRTGLASHDDLDHMINNARREHPERPGALDYPAWDIGRRWCRPTNPRCDACVLAYVCPQLTHVGSDVAGM
jgi:uncharacterized HhH-GPD family protein